MNVAKTLDCKGLCKMYRTSRLNYIALLYSIILLQL